MVRIEFTKTADGKKYRSATERTGPDGKTIRDEHALPESGQDKTKGKSRHTSDVDSAQIKEGEQ